MDSKNPAYNRDELLLRKIYDLINEGETKNNRLKLYYINEQSYKDIKINFNPVNKYKAKAKNIITKMKISI